jgi:hypothetical protein
METTKKEFLYFENGTPKQLLSEDQTRQLLGAVQPNVIDSTSPKPATSLPIFGLPRILLGFTEDGNGMCSGSDSTGKPLPFLLEVFPGTVDQFMPRGINRKFTLRADRTLPEGIQTNWWGLAPPENLPDFPGYRKRYWNGKSDQIFYEFSDLADETPMDEPIQKGVPAGDASLSNESMPVVNNAQESDLTKAIAGTHYVLRDTLY